MGGVGVFGRFGLRRAGLRAMPDVLKPSDDGSRGAGLGPLGSRRLIAAGLMMAVVGRPRFVVLVLMLVSANATTLATMP